LLRIDLMHCHELLPEVLAVPYNTMARQSANRLA
jgi:hypothetical protein